jgi:hypothetical protein
MERPTSEAVEVLLSHVMMAEENRDMAMIRFILVFHLLLASAL